jgi:hypothetical protein
LKSHPEAERKIQRKAEGVYTIHGRDVKVAFGAQTSLVVQDGPLIQPFVDYLEGKEASAVYHKAGLTESCLNQVPKDARLSYDDDDGTYFSRVESMAIAKEQALFREMAANYVKQGRTVPSTLKTDCEKTIEKKLGRAPRKTQSLVVEPVAPAWWESVAKQREAKPEEQREARAEVTIATASRLTSGREAMVANITPVSRLTSGQDGAATVPQPGHQMHFLAREGATSVPFPYQQKAATVHHPDGSKSMSYPRQHTRMVPPLAPTTGIHAKVSGATAPGPAPLPMKMRHLSPRAPLVRATSPSVQALPANKTMMTPRVQPMLRAAIRFGGA